MRIVLDTNVLARAAQPTSGPARDVLIRCTEDPHVLLLSAFILAELHRVLRYERVRQVHGLDDFGVDQYIAHVEAAGVTVALPAASTIPIVGADPEDDPIIQTAVAGQADILCTRDRHLYHADVTAYCRSHGITVIDDVELLARMRGGQSRPLGG